ncbi:hypothetical protein [Variovorax sp. dw_954]|uniref:hypothetical protein n=1 Tax=Variovorax sp. dw_954 TaxID=2720078 RepID=UPI001BD50393|nr:hypothetical protein [Variovorax sp. dw_954]
MNNSLGRLYEGMAATMSERILPHIEDDFARGQAYGVIYLLQCLKLRTDWSDAYLWPQWNALQLAVERLGPLLRGVDGAPALDAPPANGASLHQRCEAARATLCAAYDWAERHSAELPIDVAQGIRAAWQGFIEADLKHELNQRVALPYSEMSTGRATATAAAKGTP